MGFRWSIQERIQAMFRGRGCYIHNDSDVPDLCLQTHSGVQSPCEPSNENNNNDNTNHTSNNKTCVNLGR